MKNGGNYNNGNDLDILEIAFLTLTGLFFLFYFTNAEFKYSINAFYLFIGYIFNYYKIVAVLYLFNIFLFLTGVHGMYVRFFEIRLTGAKLKMHNKLEKIKNYDNIYKN